MKTIKPTNLLITIITGTFSVLIIQKKMGFGFIRTLRFQQMRQSYYLGLPRL